jgi:diguanylate cyclase (GGDEF)-like protein
MNYKYQQRLLVAATTDAMTGAANRRRFGEALTEAINRARRYPSPLSVILLDIDHFKKINDTWGHETGDRAICHVVGLCGQAVRDVDLVGRMGGEEFTILLPETDGPAAITVADRIRALLHHQLLHADDGTPVQVRCSFGIASYQEGDTFCDDILRRADIALYQAKRGGRDRVVEYRASMADTGDGR